MCGFEFLFFRINIKRKPFTGITLTLSGYYCRIAIVFGLQSIRRTLYIAYILRENNRGVTFIVSACSVRSCRYYELPCVYLYAVIVCDCLPDCCKIRLEEDTEVILFKCQLHLVPHVAACFCSFDFAAIRIEIAFIVIMYIDFQISRVGLICRNVMANQCPNIFRRGSFVCDCFIVYTLRKEYRCKLSSDFDSFIIFAIAIL